MPSLNEIESFFCTLWMKPEARTWLLSGKDAESAPSGLKEISTEILSVIDRKGAGLYARSIEYEHKDTADRIFPYCAKLLGNRGWSRLISEYYDCHPSKHFDFNKICRDFPRYLNEKRLDLLQKYPYLSELADYEWLELEKAEEDTVLESAPYLQIKTVGDASLYYPVVNQTLCIRRYEFPVTEIAEKLAGKGRVKKFSRRPSIVAVYRDPETFRSRFMELGEATASIIETAMRQPSLYIDLLKTGIRLTAGLDPQNAAIEFLELVEELQQDGIFLGSKAGDSGLRG